MEVKSPALFSFFLEEEKQGNRDKLNFWLKGRIVGLFYRMGVGVKSFGVLLGITRGSVIMQLG